MLYTSVFTAIYFTLLAFVSGACMGSFLNCLAWRTLHGESVLKGRSHCDYCGAVLKARDLVPIFSFLCSKGKARCCGKALSTSHFWRELFSAVCFVAILLRYDISLRTLEGFVFASVLMACAFADSEEYIIPDRFVVFGCGARIIFILMSENILSEALFSAVGGFVSAGALLAVVLIFEKVAKKEAMGGGDIKLIFMTGLYLGIWQNILCIFLAAVIGIVVGLVSMKKNGDSDKPIPWGPSISASAIIVFLFGSIVIDFYLALL